MHLEGEMYVCLPCLFRPVTRNTLIFLFGLTFANSLDPDQERQNARQAFKPTLDNFLEGKGARNDTRKKRHPWKKQETNAFQTLILTVCHSDSVPKRTVQKS